MIFATKKLVMDTWFLIDFLYIYLQVGFLISPVLPENSGQYWCEARYQGQTSDYTVSLNVLTQTR